MSKTLSSITEQTQGFDCSVYLKHGLQSRSKECLYAVDTRDYGGSVNSFNCYSQEIANTREPTNFPRSIPNFSKSVTFDKKALGSKFLDENYYHTEYNTLLQWIDEEQPIVPPTEFVDKRKEIRQISLLADEALGKEFRTPKCKKYFGNRFTCETLAKEVAIKAIETPRNEQLRSSWCENLAKEVANKVIGTPRDELSPGEFHEVVEEHLKGFGDSEEKPDAVTLAPALTSRGLQNLIEKQLDGFGNSPPKQKDGVFRKRRLCRHFVKGFCQRGELCDFLHDPSIFCSDAQKVFLGGLPLHFTPTILKGKLEELGLTVLNNPRIMRGYSPEVCLGSVEEARELISRKQIYVGEHRLDVRPFKDKDQLRQVVPSPAKRSVFLGGLPEDTTAEMIVNDLRRLDIKVVDCPVVKNGYAPRVVLGSLEHTKMLVALKRVMVNSTVVDVRPYVNFRKRY